MKNYDTNTFKDISPSVHMKKRIKICPSCKTINKIADTHDYCLFCKTEVLRCK